MSRWHLSPIAGMLLIGASQIAAAGSATVYYYKPYKNWGTAFIHHNASGTWTTAPGNLMDSSCTNWAAKTVDFGTASNFQAVFTNGSGAWDNNNNANYTIGSGVHQVKNGQLLANAGNPCDTTPKTATVYYKSGWAPAYLHFAPVGGTWTTAPGVAMVAACSGWQKKVVDLGVTTGLTAVFNNGSGTWDNNSGKNYSLGTGDVKVENGVAGTGNPCPINEPSPPTVPTNLVAGTVTANSIPLSWTASTDNIGVAGYEIYRNDVKVATVTTTSFTDTGLTADTSYSYKVRAFDTSSEFSAYSTIVAAKTTPLQTNQATVFYYTKSKGWVKPYLHYAPTGGAWTVAPGVQMAETACTDWAKKTVDLGAATGLTATFNNGTGTWDNNGGNNYALGQGTNTVKDGVVTKNAASPCFVDTTPPVAPGTPVGNVAGTTVTLTWAAATDAESAITGYTVTRTGGSGTVQFPASSTNFIDSTCTPATTYSYSVVATNSVGLVSASSAAATVTTAALDTTPPTVPGKPSSTVSGTSVTLSWTASTDPESAVTGYTITRTGGAGTVILTSATNSLTDTSGSANTTYSYTVAAKNSMNLVSASSEAASATTGAAPVTSSFSWDNATVYFMLNDRFVNADTSNDRSYCRESDKNCVSFGNDLTQMPSGFHGGDLKGITQKINANYFKDLGINTLWLTAPYEQVHGFVFGNDHKHYGYHGYYPLDWTAIDKNMGSKADLQALVDAAHAQGIRVVLDVVLNHTGYENIKDMAEFGYGTLKSGWEATAYKTADSLNWNNDIGAFIDYTNNWANSFWGSSWVRMNGVSGIDQCPSTDTNVLTGCVGFLPDVKTEVTNGVSLPPILVKKWTNEGRLAAEQAKLDAWFSANGKARTPANHIIKWLSDYVRDYGIDGFRVDTAKHVEQSVWKDLKTEANKARSEWLAANPSKAAALQGETAFWMTGEVYDHGVSRDSYFDNGFDSLINFSFQGKAGNTAGLDATYNELAAVNTNNNTPYNMLSYISSHDKGLFDRGNLQTGLTSLFLAPGAVQLFYGDETGRPLRTDWSGDHAWRGDMNWSSINSALLTHAQKLGKFRNAHIAVGAGSHTKLADAPYTFARVKGTDSVVVAIGASGTVQVTVGTIFADGTVVRDAYTGVNTTVSGGKATVTAGSAGVILLEAVAAIDVDTIAPTVPSGLTQSNVGSTSATISWTASSDNKGVTAYEIYRGNVLVGSSPSTSYTDTGLAPVSTYSYTVLAKDAAGNASAKSAAISVTTGVDVPDVTPPSVPLNPVASVANTTISLSWAASTDDKATTGYEITRTGGPLGTKVLTSTTNSYTDSGLAETTAYSYTIKAFDAAGNKSAQSAVVSATSKTGVSAGGSFYATNPNNQVGKYKAITLDGSGVEWTEDMIIAQGVANDDPRIFLGSHEGPVYDLYALYAAWDDSNLYLMWQFTNVTDVVDPAQGYPISDNGKPWNADIPQQIAFDIDPAKGGDGMIEGTTGAVWGIRNTFANKNVDRMAMFSSKPGVGKAAIFKLNANGSFDYATANNELFSVSGVSFKYGDGFMPAKMMGINKNGWGGYKPSDLANDSLYTNFLSTSHNKKQDTTYEMKIPLTALGIDKAYLENNGIGVMLITTFGQSGIGSLPQDPTTLDNATLPYSADASTSKEKEDNDVFTVPFARIGKK